MRNQLLLALIFLSSISVSAQYQFQYVLEFKIDSTDMEAVQKEYFNLDVIDDESIFYAEPYAQLDSIRSKGGNINSKNAPEPKRDYVVTKNLSENKIAFNEVIGFARYEVPEPREIKWEIQSDTKNFTSETDSVQQYQLQKATTSFGGRNWIAWFATELPVQDGPYKFYGLPGLIFELYDAHKDYMFSLIKIKEIDRLFSPSLFKSLGVDTYKVDFEKYKELKQNYKKNPGAVYRQFMSNMGVEIDNSNVRDFSETNKKRMEKQKNTIELSLEE